MAIDRITLAWAVTLMLFGVCWLAPAHYLDDSVILGYRAAEIAHLLFFDLFSRSSPLDFKTLFISIGWMANEAFVVGCVLARRRSRLAHRCFAFSFGIMIGWQIAFLRWPLFAIGYWVWVIAGAMALWLSARRWADTMGRSTASILADKVTMSLVALPIVCAVLTRVSQ